MVSKRAGLALLAPLIVAACVTIQMAPAAPAASDGERTWTQRTLAPPPPSAPPPSTSSQTRQPPRGWIAAPCSQQEFAPSDDPDWMDAFRIVEYAQNGRACLVPASPAAVLAFRQKLAAPFWGPNGEELAPGLDASISAWVADWRASGYPGPWSSVTYDSRTLGFQLGREVAALERAFHVGNTTRLVDVPKCATAARDALVEAVGAQHGALGAETVGEAEREVARAAELIASAKAMEATCPA